MEKELKVVESTVVEIENEAVVESNEVEVSEEKFSMTEEELKEIALSAHKEQVNDLLKVDPRLIITDVSHNVRDFNNPDVLEHVDFLANSIEKNGLITPLECRRHLKVGTYVDDRGKEYPLYSWVVVDGECRLRAIKKLIEKGVPFRTVTVIPEKKNSNEANRVLDMVNANTGLPFTPVELGRAYQKLLNFGWEYEEISEHVHKTVQYIKECLDLLSYDKDIQQAIVTKKIRAHNVRQVEKAVKKETGNNNQTSEARKKAVADRLRAAINKAGAQAELNGKSVRVGTILNKEAKKTEGQILAEHLDAVLDAIPEMESVQIKDLEELHTLLSDGKTPKDAINAVFGKKVEYAATGTED
jgi:ParB/RepB/Spo0J family partition protein